jgi:hypothetical protein
VPDPSRPAGRGLPSRRSLLAVGTLGAVTSLTSLTGCGVRVGAPGRAAESPTPGPGELARERVARDADALRALATRAAALVPADRVLLRSVAADHSAHAAALRPAAAPGSATASATSSPATSPALTAATALPVLVRGERAAAAAATAELERVSGDIARLLASVAASRALHVSRLASRSAHAPAPGSTPAGSSPAQLPAGEATALDAALAAEYAALYAYGLVGARGGPAARRPAAAALQSHALQRDLLAARLSAAGRRPAPGEPAYALPFPVTSPATARALAAHVETALAACYADLVAAAVPGRRREAAGWLTGAAEAARAWGAAATPFPGLPERAPAS